ncbi:MAG: hypothetical protein FVQ85_02190 [Planctomycetes bacterium]|nr:hypothetical protein [Planctomycetota bacterium]
MKYKFKSSIIGIGLVISIISVSGCTANRINRTNQLSVPLELVPSEDAYISRAYAYEDASELAIYGKVKHSGLEIAATQPEGMLI